MKRNELLKYSCANFGQTNTKQEIARMHNSTYKKLAVQWINEALCFVSRFVMADSFVLRKRQLLVAAKRRALIFERHHKENYEN